MALDLTQPLNEISARNLPGSWLKFEADTSAIFGLPAWKK
jgi:hypothetical protein